MAKIIASYKGESLKSLGSPFRTLANSIVGQQISVKAAEAIWLRFKKLFGRRKLNYQNFLLLKDKDLREIGLSKQKVAYLKNIANYFKNNKITANYFKKNDPTKIHDELLAIKGIGKWTLEMFQIFYLLEPDIFPLKDLGLIKAIENHYHQVIASSHCEEHRDEAIQKIAERWKPYRTVATWYLWRTFDDEPVQY